LEAEVVQETPSMIVGMFPVDSHIAEVLFDTRATHSFITASWVEAHNLSITTMSTPIQIDSAGGRIRADSICLNVSVEIRGIVFPSNLIVMGTQRIDVILGMNWLDKYQAVISCDKRTIKLVSPLVKEVVTELVSPEPSSSSSLLPHVGIPWPWGKELGLRKGREELGRRRGGRGRAAESRAQGRRATPAGGCAVAAAGCRAQAVGRHDWLPVPRHGQGQGGHAHRGGGVAPPGAGGERERGVAQGGEKK
jgi:hypothetical protein